MNASRLPLPSHFAGALALAAAVVLLPVHSDACAASGEKVAGSGVFRTEARPVAGFRSVALGVGARVELRQGDVEGLSITGDDNIVPLVETIVEDGTLRIRWKGNAKVTPSYKSLAIVVSAKNIDGLTIGGSGHIHAAQLMSSKLRVTIGGSGRMSAAGRTESLHVAVAGSGELSAARFESRRASIALQGSGQASVWAKETLDVTIAGSGDVTYRGTPQVNRTVLGSGTVRQAREAS